MRRRTQPALRRVCSAFRRNPTRSRIRRTTIRRPNPSRPGRAPADGTHPAGGTLEGARRPRLEREIISAMVDQIPSLPATYIDRPALIDAIDRVVASRLTIVTGG